MTNISNKAEVSPKAKIGERVTIYPFVYIEDDVEIGDDSIIFPFVSIHSGSRIGKRNKIHNGSVIGSVSQDFAYKGDPSQTIIGDDNILRENTVVNRASFADGKTVIGNRNFILEGTHISHDTVIGDDCVFGYGTKIAGNCEIHDKTILSASVLINPSVRTGKYSMVLAGSRVSKDIPPYIVAGENPVRYCGTSDKILNGANISNKVQTHIANAYRLIFHDQTSLFDAINQIKEQVPPSEEIDNIIRFLESSQLGIITKM